MIKMWWGWWCWRLWVVVIMMEIIVWWCDVNYGDMMLTTMMMVMVRMVTMMKLMKMVLIMVLMIFSSVQSLSRVRLFATPWTAARQASLSITNSQSSLKPMSIESVMPSNHLILCRPLLLLPSIFPSIRVFSSESVLRIRWPKYWSFSFSISPSNEYSGLIFL